VVFLDYEKKKVVVVAGLSLVIIFSTFAITLIVIFTSDGKDQGNGPPTLPFFMFHIDEVGHGQYFYENIRELKNVINENMDWTYPTYFWSELEPTDDNFNWTELDSFISNDKFRYKVINLGPEFNSLGNGNYSMKGSIPSWINNNLSGPLDGSQLRSEYRELLDAVVSRYKNNITMWWVGFEVNLGGDIDVFNWTMWKQWLNWQVEDINAKDPDGKIMISFGSWIDYHEQIPPTGIDEINGTLQLINMSLDFDVVGIEYHYGTLQNGTLTNLMNAIEQLKACGKEIFIWEVFCPSETDLTYQANWTWDFPPQEGYSEEWQATQLLEILKMSYNDPQIIGLNMFHFLDITYNEINPEEWEAGWRCHAGLIRANGTAKKAYYDIKDYWNSICE
jgi:hypothetical protein